MTGTEPSQVRQVDVHTAARMKADGALLLDVREVAEWAAGHAPGASHMPLGELDVEAVPAGRTVLAMCRSGNRSSKAAAALSQVGVDVVNVAGGMKAWQEAGFPVVDDHENAGSV